tara:strand:- start:84 stop:761 length:678 start_codon:yes stop_codon:yes gene_type:complete
MKKNFFTYNYLKKIIKIAKNNNYKFIGLKDFNKFINLKKKFILRLDIDFYPKSLRGILDISKKFKIPLTIYVRVAGPYNIFWYENYQIIKEAIDQGHTIGLHSNNVERAKLLKKNNAKCFEEELRTLNEAFGKIITFAPHRDINYMENSLPWIEKNWLNLKKKYNLKFHAYEKRFFKNFIYINEGMNPHLTWRNITPESAIKQKKNIYMLIHPHWWFEKNPHEHY